MHASRPIGRRAASDSERRLVGGDPSGFVAARSRTLATVSRNHAPPRTASAPLCTIPLRTMTDGGGASSPLKNSSSPSTNCLFFLGSFKKPPSSGQSPPEPPPKHAAPLKNEVLQRAASDSPSRKLKRSSARGLVRSPPPSVVAPWEDLAWVAREDHRVRRRLFERDPGDAEADVPRRRRLGVE